LTFEMKAIGGPITEEHKKELHELLAEDARFEEMVERAVRGMGKSGRRAKELLELLGRLEKSLAQRATQAARRSPDTLFEVLLFLDVALELKGRIV